MKSKTVAEKVLDLGEINVEIDFNHANAVTVHKNVTFQSPFKVSPQPEMVDSIEEHDAIGLEYNDSNDKRINQSSITRAGAQRNDSLSRNGSGVQVKVTDYSSIRDKVKAGFSASHNKYNKESFGRLPEAEGPSKFKAGELQLAKPTNFEDNLRNADNGLFAVRVAELDTPKSGTHRSNSSRRNSQDTPRKRHRNF